MTDFSKILDKAKELEAKMKESQQKIKEIRVEGVSGSKDCKKSNAGSSLCNKSKRSIIVANERHCYSKYKTSSLSLYA